MTKKKSDDAEDWQIASAAIRAHEKVMHGAKKDFTTVKQMKKMLKKPKTGGYKFK